MEAVLDAPDPTTGSGIRDRAMLLIAFTAGLRVSELVGLRVADASLQPAPQSPKLSIPFGLPQFSDAAGEARRGQACRLSTAV